MRLAAAPSLESLCQTSLGSIELETLVISSGKQRKIAARRRFPRRNGRRREGETEERFGLQEQGGGIRMVLSALQHSQTQVLWDKWPTFG